MDTSSSRSLRESTRMFKPSGGGWTVGSPTSQLLQRSTETVCSLVFHTRLRDSHRLTETMFRRPLKNISPGLKFWPLMATTGIRTITHREPGYPLALASSRASPQIRAQMRADFTLPAPTSPFDGSPGLRGPSRPDMRQHTGSLSQPLWLHSVNPSKKQYELGGERCRPTRRSSRANSARGWCPHIHDVTAWDSASRLVADIASDISHSEVNDWPESNFRNATA